jgi:hypothetical protein
MSGCQNDGTTVVDVNGTVCTVCQEERWQNRRTWSGLITYSDQDAMHDKQLWLASNFRSRQDCRIQRKHAPVHAEDASPGSHDEQYAIPIEDMATGVFITADDSARPTRRQEWRPRYLR